MIKSKLILVLGTQSSIFCEELRLIGAVVGGRRSCGSCGWLQTPVAGLFLLIVLLTEISLISSRMGLVLRSSCRWRRSPGGTAEVHAARRTGWPASMWRPSSSATSRLPASPGVSPSVSRTPPGIVQPDL